MNKILSKLANRLGYRISKLSEQPPFSDAFTDMQRLMTKMEITQPLIFDVGAHHGLISGKFRELFPASAIYAFEPFKASFDQLRNNTAADPGIHAFNFGLSNREGMERFHSNPASQTNSLFSTDERAGLIWGPGTFGTQEMVSAEFKTVDNFMATQDIQEIDILKLDVQGAEPLVIEGAAEACRRGAIRLIYSEILTQPTYQGQKRLDEALAVFYDNGFDLYNIYNYSLTLDGRLREVDVIFTKTS